MATINQADLYGISSGARPQHDVIGVSGPNQGAVMPPRLAGPVGNASPAFSWLGFALALVALRIAIEMGGRIE